MTFSVYRSPTSMARVQRLDKTALVQLSNETAISEVFWFCALGFRKRLLQLLQQARYTRGIGRNSKSGFDDQLVGFLEHFSVVGPEIFSHGFHGECLVCLTADRAFDVRPEKTPHHILVRLYVTAARYNPVDMILDIEFWQIE